MERMIKSLTFGICIGLNLLRVSAQTELVYDNFIYDPQVKSVIFSKANVDDRYPVITLNSSEQLSLGFDMLGKNNEFFQYTVVHCDAHWNPTPMQQTEYIRGLTLDNINDWKFSTNTYVRYVHYNLILPNENMGLTIAGNYLLKVFRNFDETDLVL
ncbi:MAG: type IX secretion system plug protein domain-containing protein, partial [Bacteroidia bacterium]